MKTLFTQSRTYLVLGVLTALNVGGASLAQKVKDTDENRVKINQLSRRHIIEKLDGKESDATVLEVTLEPGHKDGGHRHAGPVFGYVLEGDYEHAINDERVKSHKAGDTFYEPTGCLHRLIRSSIALAMRGTQMIVPLNSA